MREENVMVTRQLERINRYTSVETGIYVEGELIKFCEAKLFNGQLGISLPVSFRDMSPEDARKKYFSEQRPEVIKTNEDGSINFCFSMAERKVRPEHLESLIQDFYDVLKRFQPMSVCLDMGTEFYGSIPCARLEFISNALNENLYNMLTIYPLTDKLLLGMFNCPFNKYKEWTNCLSQVRKSLVIYNQ